MPGFLIRRRDARRWLAAGLILILAGTAGCDARGALARKRRSMVERSLMRAVYL